MASGFVSDLSRERDRERNSGRGYPPAAGLGVPGAGMRERLVCESLGRERIINACAVDFAMVRRV